MRRARHARAALAAVCALATAADVLAQDEAAAEPGGGAVESPGSPTIIVQPAAPVAAPAPAPGSGSTTYDAAPSSDIGYGFSRGGEAGEPVVTGEGEVIVGDSTTSRTTHLVQPGDTLSSIAAAELGSRWQWPELWAMNPQIQNPHWIYPGDELRVQRPRSEGAIMGIQGLGRLVPDATVFLRDFAWIDDPERERWGQVTGSAEDQQLLSYDNHVYMLLDDDHDVAVGQELAIYIPASHPRRVAGARMPSGQVVRVIGTARVTYFDAEKRVARATVTEAMDVIERGALVGPVKRTFVVVPPRESRVTLWARVLVPAWPVALLGAEQLVFIDQGAEDGLVAGNRLVAVRRGDAWRRSYVRSSPTVRARMKTETDLAGDWEYTPLLGEEEDLPDEVIGELHVIRADPTTSLCLVTRSRRELATGDRVLARAGR